MLIVGGPEKGRIQTECENIAHSAIGYHHRHLIREKMTQFLKNVQVLAHGALNEHFDKFS